MNILHAELTIFNPEENGFREEHEIEVDPRPTAEWIRYQAELIRSQDSELAQLVAERIEALADDWLVLAGGKPMSVGQFRDRFDLCLEVERACDYV